MSLLINNSDALPDDAGAYLLLIYVARPLSLPKRFAGKAIPKGRYGYAGSARGPGGIKARCRRHLSRPNKRHWHVDWLTGPARDVKVIAFPGGSECSLISRLLGHPRVSLPFEGFGSTDCRQCPAHLVRFEALDRWDDLTATLNFLKKGPDASLEV